MISFSKLGRLGRLGNQMFQISATIGAAINNGTEAIIPVWQFRRYFNSNIEMKKRLNPAMIYHEPHYHYAPIPDAKDMDIYGYFQSEKYFKHCEWRIREFFTPSSWVAEDLKRWGGMVEGKTGIHIRRGDYVHLQDYHPVQEMSYYQRAMEMIGGEFVLFTDDIRWANENFPYATPVNTRDAVIDFLLMSRCQNNIICNSSFSWWASWLNPNPDKIVIAPQRWFGNAVNNNTKDLYCENWKVI